MISFFGPYNLQSVAMRLDFGLQWLFESADMIHSAFRVPAPQVAELADRFVRERREQHGCDGQRHRDGGPAHLLGRVTQV